MRARNLKPGFFKNEKLGTVDPLIGQLFQGLWLMSDREGRLEDRPLRICGELFAYRRQVTEKKVDQWLDWLESEKFIERYEVGGNAYIQVLAFEKHNNPHKNEKPSEIPALSSKQHSASTVQAPCKVSTSTVPLRLNPSSLIPESGILNPDSSLREIPVPKSDGVDRVFDHWRTTHRHEKAQLDDKRRKAIRRALDSYSEADLCQAITGYLHSPHHMGQNERHTKFDDVELFLRDAKHIDAGLRFYAEPPRTDLSETTRRIVSQTEDWAPPEVRRAAS